MRAALIVAVVGAVALAGAAHAKGFGEAVRVSRALEEQRIEDARAALAPLLAAHGDEPDVRFLAAQVDFLEGDYAGARKKLVGITGELASASKELDRLLARTEQATKGFVTRDFPHFTIAYGEADEVLVDVAGEALEAAYRTIGDDFGWKAKTRVRVELLARPRDLAMVSTLTEDEIETSGTIALCKYNKLMVVSPRATVFGYPWLDTMAHEYTHYVVSRVALDKVPIWLHEGLAKFEETRWRAPAGKPLGRAMVGYLAQALRRGRLITFEEMHPSMAKLPSQEAAATAFAEVASLVGWLHAKIGYEGIRDVLARVASGKTERRAIGEVLDKGFPEVEAAWRAHLRATVDKSVASPKVLRGGKIKFKKGKQEDADDAGLDEVREGTARRHAKIAGLLRGKNRLGAAAIEYEKALAAAGGDPLAEPLVAARLARTMLEIGNPKRAIELATPLAARDDEDALPAAVLGEAYRRAGEPAKAIPYLEAALRLSPFDPAVRCGLAEVYAASAQPALAAREQHACDVIGKR